MSEYTLFGKTVTFDDSTERFVDFQQSAWDAMNHAEGAFRSWYEKCGNIDAVLEECQQKAETLIAEYATTPLFGELVQLGIYDISKAAYEKECVDYSGIYAALTEVEDRYVEILDNQSEQAAYREARKDSRGRFVGGGFGLGGALEGAATAGALNMLSGAGHGLVNAVGNWGSSIEASTNRSALYSSKSTQNKLVNGLRESILACFNAHLKFVNREKGETYRGSPFNADKADALMDSAQKVPEKRKELLIEAFTALPYKDGLLEYIFENYEEERKNIWGISKRFHVDLSNSVETVIAREYSEEAQKSDYACQASKAKILAIMKEYDITQSETLDKLNHDYLARLCRDYEKIDKELICNKLLAKIESYDAPDAIKKSYIEKIQSRIEMIWTAEDFDRFEELYTCTSMTDNDMIAHNLNIVKTTGRTSAKSLFIEAFSNLNPQNIRIAAVYGVALERGGLSLVKEVTKRGMYNKLTIEGKITHPDIVTMMETVKSEQRASKGKGLFGGLFGAKSADQSSSQNTSSTLTESKPVYSFASSGIESGYWFMLFSVDSLCQRRTAKIIQKYTNADLSDIMALIDSCPCAIISGIPTLKEAKIILNELKKVEKIRCTVMKEKEPNVYLRIN